MLFGKSIQPVAKGTPHFHHSRAVAVEEHAAARVRKDQSFADLPSHMLTSQRCALQHVQASRSDEDVLNVRKNRTFRERSDGRWRVAKREEILFKQFVLVETAG